MAPHFDGTRWLPAARLALLAAVVLLPARAPGQSSESDGTYYSRQTTFSIPFSLTDQRDRRIRQVYLHVSEDYGRGWRRAGSALPADRSFRFEAPRDGWYWFAVQTQDAEGRLYPPSLDGARPELKLCVDRIKPLVTLRGVPAREGAVAVEWDVRDDNLDLASLRLDYRAVGARDWVPLGAPRLARGQHSWSPTATGPLEVRLEVRDKALNQAEATANVSPAGGATATAPPAAPVGTGLIHVRSRTFQLDYTIENIGPSNVKSVDVWLTRDTHAWRLHATNEAKPMGPYLVTITVPAAGRYGLTLIPRSGVGLADPPPRNGDAPQVWVQVDETKPLVQIRKVDVGRGADAGRLTVWYSARDEFLRVHPITLSYRVGPADEWKPLAAGVDNTGAWTGTTETLPYEFYVRVEAVDEAGNVSSAETAQTVKVDLKIPRARIGNVKVVPSEPGMPPSP